MTNYDVLDQNLGTLLERWLNRETSGCKFCNEKPFKPKEEFCSIDCHDEYMKIQRAREALSDRDITQRGHD